VGITPPGNGKVGYERFLDEAIDDNPPVEVTILVICCCMAADAGCTVAGEGVVPFGVILQGVYPPQVIQTAENRAEFMFCKKINRN
jgi:hypothetical protein